MIKDLNILRTSELFENLTPDEIGCIAPVCFDQITKQDSIIFAEGRHASHLYLVAEGKVALQKGIRVPHARDSRRATVTFCNEGEVVGWSALVPPYRYTLTAVTWRSGTLISLDSKLLHKALEVYPAIGFKVMTSLSKIMSRRLRQTTDALISEREASYYAP